jgi:hypothetical protein
VSAGKWITRGEDDRTFMGGYIYSLSAGGATVMPIATATTPFAPSPGGVSGLALQVSGSIPPPTTTNFPIAGLGWRFTPAGQPINAVAAGTGITMWIKSALSATSSITFQISILDIWTDGTYANCSTQPNSPNLCYDYPLATCTIAANGTWQFCGLPWSSFTRPNYGGSGAGAALDTSQVTGVQINPVPPMMGASTLLYDFAVDDVAFQ